MKNISILLGFLCSLLYAQAQNITILDQYSLQPISGVEVKIDQSAEQIGLSDKNGKKSLDKKMDEYQIITFIHPMYTPVQLTYIELVNNNFIVLMHENINSLQEIVVSASRFEEKKQDVAQKIQVIRSSELSNLNQSSTADVLANSGNILVQKSQLGGGSPVIRGFEANRVLIVIDGVRMNNAIYRGGHLQNVITLDNSIMDRVEIVYGPGSVVYGSDALGGVMSFSSKNPVLSKDDETVIKAAAYTRYMSAASGYAAHADISVSGKKIGSLTSFTYSSFGDLRQGANRDPEVGNFGARPWYVQRINGLDSTVINKDTNLQVGSGYSQYDVLQKFMYHQNDNIRHTLNFQFSNSSNIDRYDRLTQVAGGNPKYAEWYYGPQKRIFASYTLELLKKNIFYDKARLIFGYQQIEESRIERKYRKDLLNHRIENLHIITGNFDFVKKTGRNELRYGFEGWYNDVNSSAFSKNISTGEITSLDTRYASGGAIMHSLAFYATHTLEINEKLILNDGLRFSNVNLTALFTDTTFFNFPFNEAVQKNNALNGNLGLIYMPESGCRVTALLSSGFRAPNVDDLSRVFESTPGTINVPNPNLKPEYTYNGEIGVSNSFNNWLNASATGYYTIYRNALTTQNFTYNGQDSIIYGGVMSKVVATTNANKAYMYGLELALNGTLNNNISFYATYNYTYARIVTDTTAVPLDHIPPVFGKFGMQLTEKKFRADFFVNWSACKKIEDYNPFGEDNQAYALPQGMPSWYTINTRLTYQFNKYVGVQVACENILDRNYRVFASNISAPGRNFIVTLRGSF
jgi:hemoglobin/transferrin/lactoferrin receptor protein